MHYCVFINIELIAISLYIKLTSADYYELDSFLSVYINGLFCHAIIIIYLKVY